VAADLLKGANTYSDHYTPEQRSAFEEYIASRIALIKLPQPDTEFLRERLLTMYANPLFNQEAAQ
jgi:hypothetical protein